MASASTPSTVRNARFSWWRICPEYRSVASVPALSATCAVPSAAAIASGSGLGCMRTVTASASASTCRNRLPGVRRNHRISRPAPRRTRIAAAMTAAARSGLSLAKEETRADSPDSWAP
jgi:hypothetical protein